MRTILTNAGKADLLTRWKEGELFMGFGSGDADWFTDRSIEEEFNNDTLNLGFGYVDSVVVQSQDESIQFTQGEDYTVNLTTGVLTRLPGGSIAEDAIVKIDFHVNCPPAMPNATALVAPFGYKKITAKSFAELSDSGNVEVDTGKFNLVLTPMPHLYVASTLATNEFVGNTIREVALFFGLIRANGVPSGQAVLTPNQVASVGIMCGIKRRTPLVRDGITEHAFQRVLSL